MTISELFSILATLAGVACFSVVFTVLYRTYAASSIREIESGKRDPELLVKTSEEKDGSKKNRKAVATNVLYGAVMFLLICAFVLSAISKLNGGRPLFGSTVMVVASGSMSERNEANGYLGENGLTDQFSQYDLIVLRKVVSESELGLYDVIAYRNNTGTTIIHRIVGITAEGYVTRGDANSVDDPYHPVFADVIGVYTGTRIPAVGIFVLFAQSYAGIVTFLALLYCLFMIDGTCRKIRKCEDARTEMLRRAVGRVEPTAEIRAEFGETIYYNGTAYRFDEKGFVGKAEIREEKEDEKGR